jgi:hypothetical protein
MDDIKAQLITRDFNRMLEEFASISPEIEFKQIVRAVAIRVIAGALRRTRAADANRIRESREAAEFTTMDGKLYKLSNYFHNDALWNRITNKRRASLQKKLAARGLAKQSWYIMAQKLGTAIDVPSYVDAANYDGKTYPGDVNYVDTTSGGAYALKIINASPIVQQAGGQAALIFAMQAETRYFQTLLAKGAFRNAATRAAKYPGVYVKPTGPTLAA